MSKPTKSLKIGLLLLAACLFLGSFVGDIISASAELNTQNVCKCQPETCQCHHHAGVENSANGLGIQSHSCLSNVSPNSSSDQQALMQTQSLRWLVPLKNNLDAPVGVVSFLVMDELSLSSAYLSQWERPPKSIG